MEEFSVTVNGFSKSMAMTGWRLGYLVAPSSIAKCVTAIHGHLVTGACSFAQRAAALALRDERTDKTVRDMIEEYQVRRDIVVRELAKVNGISCFSPKGTFYAFPNIASIGLKSQELAMKLLDRSKVAVVPGDAFGKCGEGFIRLSFATSRDRLKIALERIRDAVSELR
jgi:aspartate aminotransferase